MNCRPSFSGCCLSSIYKRTHNNWIPQCRWSVSVGLTAMDRTEHTEKRQPYLALLEEWDVKSPFQWKPSKHPHDFENNLLNTASPLLYHSLLMLINEATLCWDSRGSSPAHRAAWPEQQCKLQKAGNLLCEVPVLFPPVSVSWPPFMSFLGLQTGHFQFSPDVSLSWNSVRLNP